MEITGKQASRLMCQTLLSTVWRDVVYCSVLCCVVIQRGMVQDESVV